MIPKIIHYCWFGRGEMPQQSKECIDSWHKFMPDWEYKLWNEGNFDVNVNRYVREAYESGKYAFVSDYARLVVLKEYGGVYMDVDFLAFKSFAPLLSYKAFAGFEGSKKNPVMMGVIASEADGQWVKEQLALYDGLRFARDDGSLDMMPNTTRISLSMQRNGFVPNGKEQDYEDLHIFPVDFFCPRQTTGEYLKTENTYCDHIGTCSWDFSQDKYFWIRRIVGQKNMARLIKFKRKLFG